MKGKIILIPFPYTDLTASKLRPALVVFEGTRDYIVAFITTKMINVLQDLDVIIRAEDPEFLETDSSYFRLEVDKDFYRSERSC